jgi:hypothetical protein
VGGELQREVRVGEHTEAVLRDWLGLDAAQVAAAREAGAVPTGRRRPRYDAGSSALAARCRSVCRPAAPRVGLQ